MQKKEISICLIYPDPPASDIHNVDKQDVSKDELSLEVAVSCLLKDKSVLANDRQI